MRFFTLTRNHMGRPKRDDVFETARTKAWYFSVRRAIVQKYDLDETSLKPDDVRGRIDANDESNIWHKYSTGKHSPTNITNYKAEDRTRLRTRFKMNMALLPLLAVQSYCLRRGA